MHPTQQNQTDQYSREEYESRIMQKTKRASKLTHLHHLTSNVTETVQTFPTYIKAATRNFLSKGAAGVIIAEQVPTNVWESGSYKYTPSIFSYYDM